MSHHKKNGYGLIEIIIVATIGILVFLSVSRYLNAFLKASIRNIENTEALFLSKSSLEQARAVRDESWTNISGLTIGNSYYFAPNSGSPEKWIAQAGTKNKSKYTIWVTTSAVERDSNDDIISSGGTIDPNTLKITSYVSWPDTNGTSQISLSEYLTNFR